MAERTMEDIFKDFQNQVLSKATELAKIMLTWDRHIITSDEFYDKGYSDGYKHACKEFIRVMKGLKVDE